jgi:hypothetical protein
VILGLVSSSGLTFTSYLLFETFPAIQSLQLRESILHFGPAMMRFILGFRVQNIGLGLGMRVESLGLKVLVFSTMNNAP